MVLMVLMVWVAGLFPVSLFSVLFSVVGSLVSGLVSLGFLATVLRGQFSNVRDVRMGVVRKLRGGVSTSIRVVLSALVQAFLYRVLSLKMSYFWVKHGHLKSILGRKT